MQSNKQFILSYITVTGQTVLNHLIEGKSSFDAIGTLAEEGTQIDIILSCVPVTKD